MKVRISEESLPSKFKLLDDYIQLERDVCPVNNSRLKLKLLVFKNKKDLQKFWKKRLQRDIGNACVGAVTPLGYEVINFETNVNYLCVDKKYFAIMGLCKTHLSMEVVCHESMHAGIAYAKRTKYKDFWKNIGDLDEELICYPSGRIATNINTILHKNKMYA